VPASVKVFLAALAIIDDIGAILVIEFFYTKTVLFSYLLVAVGILLALFVLNRTTGSEQVKRMSSQQIN
jgi:NhaA family Na+:H+ antiporter